LDKEGMLRLLAALSATRRGFGSASRRGSLMGAAAVAAEVVEDEAGVG